jgi:hypothetical protein
MGNDFFSIFISYSLLSLFYLYHPYKHLHTLSNGISIAKQNILPPLIITENLVSHGNHIVISSTMMNTDPTPQNSLSIGLL